MLYREIIAVCSEIHTKYINAMCWQHLEFWLLDLVVRIVTTELESVNWRGCGRKRSFCNFRPCPGIWMSSNTINFVTGCSWILIYILCRWILEVTNYMQRYQFYWSLNQLHEFRAIICPSSGPWDSDYSQWRTEGVLGGSNPSRNSEDIGGVLDRMSRKNRRLDFLL